MSQSSNVLKAYINARPESAALYKRAKNTLGGAVGHDVRHFHPVPMYIKHAKGGRKWDIDGNEYVDFLLGNGALLLGHSHLPSLKRFNTPSMMEPTLVTTTRCRSNGGRS